MLCLKSRFSILTALLLLTLLFASCGRDSPSSQQEPHTAGQQQEQSEKPSQNVQVLTPESPTLSKDQVIRRAKLTPDQGKKLVALIGDSKDFENNNVIILPTNVPDGFTVDEINLWQGKSTNPDGLAGYYQIVYKHPYGACFWIGGGELSYTGGGFENSEEISDIQSPVLGSVHLVLFDSSKQDSNKSMELLVLKGRNEYKFESPFLGNFLHVGSDESFYKSRQKYKDCKMMNLQDAKRVVQSLQFLNP